MKSGITTKFRQAPALSEELTPANALSNSPSQIPLKFIEDLLAIHHASH